MQLAESEKVEYLIGSNKWWLLVNISLKSTQNNHNSRNFFLAKSSPLRAGPGLVKIMFSRFLRDKPSLDSEIWRIFLILNNKLILKSVFYSYQWILPTRETLHFCIKCLKWIFAKSTDTFEFACEKTWRASKILILVQFLSWFNHYYSNSVNFSFSRDFHFFEIQPCEIWEKIKKNWKFGSWK